MKLLGILAGILLYMEIIYHLGCFGLSACNPVFAFLLTLIISSVEALVISSRKEKWRKRFFWIFAGSEYVLFGVQLVYMRIFKQPMQWEAMVRGGGDALTNYWREALAGILGALPFLLLMAVPLLTVGIYIRQKKWELPKSDHIGMLRLMLGAGVGMILMATVVLVGKYIEADYYEDYSEFYDPLTIAEKMGVLTLVQRDTAGNILQLGELLNKTVRKSSVAVSGQPQETYTDAPNDSKSDNGQEPDDSRSTEESQSAGTGQGEEGGQNVEGGQETTAGEEGEMQEILHQLPIDFAALKAGADNEQKRWLAEYLEAQPPSSGNDYTGIFEGYNLIFLTAEGFSPYAVREDLTPTLYRLVHSGFDFTNYYVPLWQTSTSDGEYVNCTGLIPDGQFSMRKSGSNDMAFTLPGFFDHQGASSLAYHNNSLSYYDRYITHNNLGYVFKAARLGSLSEAQWGQYIFPMEHPDEWPASDLEMMQGTVPEYIGMDRFNIYYLTVSGHMNYNFSGNAMAAKHREEVAGLSMSETARAYIACQMELDQALEYLIEQLTEAGKLQNTVICLSADHYPYGMKQEEYEELAGRSLSENLELYRNNLILWNVKLEDDPVKIDKVCTSVDILPTLLNLFGFSFDSRLYAGRDIFSEEEGLVIFNDKSFITDSVIYNRKTKQTFWKQELPQEEASAYLEQKKQEVKDRYQLSAYILREDYYRRIEEALP